MINLFSKHALSFCSFIKVISINLIELYSQPTLYEIHNRVAGYLKEMYGDIGECTLADDQDHVYVESC